jgi:selenocysteine lyase/cysteine desulfurase
MDARLRQWRADTPGCSSRIHLNNAGAALMPTPVLRATVAHLELEATLGGYEAAEACMPQIERCYEDLAALLNAAPRNVAVVANATAGFIQALSTIDFKPGDAIVTSRCDYTSNQIQYLALKQRLGVSVLRAADLPEGGVDADSVRDLARQHRCRLVAISWVPTNSGLVQDVQSVGRVCQELEIPYLIDACQAAGQIPMDVTQLGCDYLSFTARKFLRGPRGIGALYVSDRALARGDYPLFVDMRGARWLAGDQIEFERTARRFEDWEFPYALVLGQGAAVHYAMEVGIDVAQARAWQLAAHARACLESIRGVKVLDRGQPRCAIVTASIRGWHANDAVKELAQRGINTSASLREYGVIDFSHRGIDSAVRISPHYYNTTDEIEQLAATITELADSSCAETRRSGDHFQGS